MEEVRFKKSKEYAVTGLSINQGLDSSLVAVTDTDRQEAISTLIQKLVKEKKDSDLDLRIYNEEALEKIIPFKRKTKSEIPPIKLIFYYTTTKKTRRSRILQLYASPRKIWVSLGRYQP